jgi:hypothetical protein
VLLLVGNGWGDEKSGRGWGGEGWVFLDYLMTWEGFAAQK